VTKSDERQGVVGDGPGTLSCCGEQLRRGGAVIQVQGTLGSTTTTYATSIGYAPQGAPKDISFGNTKHEEVCFNSRQQPVGVRVGPPRPMEPARTRDGIC